MSVFSFQHLDMLEKVLEKIKNPGTQLLERPWGYGKNQILELFLKNPIFLK